jgi:hypothetical protein
MRLVIDEMPTAAVLPYLDAVGWRDATGHLAPLLTAVADRADPIALLDLDVDTQVRPKVGVELYLRREGDNLARWQAMLEFLAERGLASRDKTEALLAWPGLTQESPASRDWAENLAPGDLLLRGLARSVFWRSLNHIKLSYQADRGAEVKMYLGFGHNWFPAGASSGAA